MDETRRDWPTGFMLIQGNRMEELRALMVAWMGRYPLKPLENEVILVQSNGIGQWLKLALASGRREGFASSQGIAAALDIMLPARFVWRVYRAVLGELPETSPFDKGPLVWRIYRLLAQLDDPGRRVEQGPSLEALAPLRTLLNPDGSSSDPRRRYALAEHLADLFDQYQVYRADWLAAWARGEDILIRADGKRTALPPDLAWQPALWRALLESSNAWGMTGVGAPPSSGPNHQWSILEQSPPVPPRGSAGDPLRASGGGAGPQLPVSPGLPDLAQSSRALVHCAFLEEARAQRPRFRAARLPRRVIVFGISALPQQTLEVLEALAPVSQVLLFVLNPSRHYWGDLIEGRELFRGPYRRHPPRQLPKDLDAKTLHLHGHPLLAAWGRQGRDYLRLLDAHDERTRYEAHFSGLAGKQGGIDLFVSPGQDCLLHQLQEDILELRSLKERQELATVIDPDRDRSLEFIIAHHPQREIEILHDRLLAELDQAATTEQPLEPRDVLVMVPDIGVYAPHIQAVFGRLDRDDRRYIPFRIADQSERRRNPLLIGLERLLRLPQARLTVSEVLDWLDIPAFHTRFGIDAASLPTLRHWIAGANVRWGLDREHRTALGFTEGLTQHTWRFGLDRLLLGFANGASGPWRGIEPYEAIGGLEAALVGPLAELLDRLRHYWDILSKPHPPSDWVGLVGALIDDCLVETNEADALTLGRVMQALDDWAADCAQGGLAGESLPYEIFCASFLPRLDQTHLNQHFVSGAVNFATLMPMRAIPFRQIWILGLNDGDYPRQRLRSDFDLMADDYRPGDRSRRDDDRYLFLEALLSARDKLVIGWVGRDSRDNSPRQPSVLVTQLRDHLAAGWRLPEGRPGRLIDALTTVYPLQPFSRSYFVANPLPQIFTYAQEWCSADGGEGRHLGEDHQSVIAAQAEVQKSSLISTDWGSFRIQVDAGMGKGAEGTDNGGERDMARRLTPGAPGTEPLIPWLPETPLGLDGLEAFLKSPVDALFKQRLHVPSPHPEDVPPDVEPFSLSGLAAWRLRDLLIDRCFVPKLSHAKLCACLRAAITRLQAQGELMTGPLGETMGLQIAAELEALYEDWSAALAEWPEISAQPLPIRLAIETPAGRLSLEDSLSDRRRGKQGAGQILVTASRLDRNSGSLWKHAIGTWLRHLAAQLAGEPVETRLLAPGFSLTLAPIASEQAQDSLENLLDAWWQGMHRPLPVALHASRAWIESGGEHRVPGPEQVPRHEAKPTEADWHTHPAWRKAAKAYVDQDLANGRHLRRCYPDFPALWSGGAFADWADRLYGDLYAALRDSA